MKYTYLNNKELAIKLVKKLKIKSKQNSISRAVVFFSAITIFWFFSVQYLTFSFIGASILLGIFLFLVQKSSRLKIKIKKQEILVSMNQDELDCLEGKFSQFDAGTEFIDANHSFTSDLDIFGENSIFQYLNRTCTIGGKTKLSNLLQEPEQNKKKLEERQLAIKELSTKLAFRQDFFSEGFTHKKEAQAGKSEPDFIKKIQTWIKEPAIFSEKKFLKLIMKIFPFIFVGGFIISFFGYLPSILIVFFGLLQLGIVSIYLKQINAAHQQVSKNSEQLLMYSKLLYCIENEKFNSNLLQSLQENLISQSSSAGKKIGQLKSVVKSFDNRLNFVYAILSNFGFMQDLRLLIKLEKFKISIGNALPVWFATVAEFEVLCCFAGFYQNNPDFCFPEISEDEFFMETKEMGHPLLHKSVRVCNDFSLQNLHTITIVTGANMAGKSTFLRTTGVNLILAMTGAPVCAKKYVFSPIKIYTSVRATDSLHKNESYFFAELLRLKTMIHRLKNNEKLFIILDEILRGTNSKDKHEGSQGLIEQLLKYKTAGLVATHDVELGNLIDKYPENILNKRFEAVIKNNQLSFDYRLKSGVSKNLNAVFLMKKYGIIAPENENEMLQNSKLS